MSELEKEYFWEGSVPQDWKTIPAGIVFSESKELAGQDDLHLTPSQNYGVITQDEYRKLTGHQLVRSTKSAVSMKHVEPDDFIISMASHLSGLERSRVTGKVSGDYRVLRPNPLFSTDYLGYLMKSHDIVEILNLLTTEIRVGQRISYGRFSLMRLPFPPLPTQLAIADYLDRETAEIDGMRADLDEMERLLTERRTNVIEDALKEAAKHGTIPLGYVATTIAGGTPSTSNPSYWCRDDEEGHPWVTIGDMSSTPLVTTTEKQVTEAGIGAARLSIGEPGTILFAMYGATLGAVSRLGLTASWNQAILGIFPDGSLLSPDFLELSLIASKNHLVTLHRGNTQNNLNAEQVKGLRIPLPPLAEQRRIADEIDRETAEIDSMLEDITKLRDLLAERRAAVISAAVTGQIDIPVSPTHKDEPHA